MNTRVSLYRLQDKNAAASIAGDNNHYTALGKRVMQGVELEASGALTDRWSIHAGYSYLSPKIKRAATTRDDGIFLLAAPQRQPVDDLRHHRWRRRERDERHP